MTPLLEVMLDLLPFGGDAGVLADVRREIRHALEVSADKQELKRRSRRGILHHVREQHAEDRLVECIDLVVGGRRPCDQARRRRG